MARTEGQWKKGISLITPSEDVPVLLRNSYLNFGGTIIGESGYGIRDNAGTIQVKSSGGAWASISTGGGEANTAANLGAGQGIYASKIGVALNFKSLVAGTGMGLSSDGDTITLTATSGSGDVTGPASAVNNQIAVFDGVTGKIIKDGGATIDAIRANTTNVTAAGALMDSEVTNLAQVKAFDSADYATAAQGGLADSAVQPGDLATVATSGAYSDLTGTPDLSVYDNFEPYTNEADFPATGDADVIYLETSSGTLFRWTGSAYVTISAQLALGETSSTAYRGDRGKTAYDHSQVTTGNPHNVLATQITDFDTEVSNNTDVTANTAKVSYPGSASATELNILDGATVTTAELNILDGVTATTAEINKLDGVAGAVVGTTDTQTITNKRVNPRTSSTASTATLTPDLSSANVFYVTAQAAALTIAAPTGTPVLGETISINIKDNATARGLTFNAAFKFLGTAAPTTTTISKWLTVTAQYAGGGEWLTTYAEEV